METLIKLNGQLKNTFDLLYNRWLNFIYNENKQKENITTQIKLRDEIFMDPYLRTYFMYNVTNELLNFDPYAENELREYFEIEYEIIRKLEQIYKKLEEYENSIENINHGTISHIDIENFNLCINEAYSNYQKRITSTSFKFYSTSMQNSLYHDMPIDLSIEEEKVIHLLGIGSEKSTNIFSILYQYHLNYNQPISYIDFITKYSQKYLNGILLEQDNGLIPQTKISKIITLCGGIQKIKETIEKSFVKCLNFRKIYEYKFIPEIIFDYEGTKELIIPKYKSLTKEVPYNYLTSTNAQTPMSKKDTLKLSYFIEHYDNLSEEDKKIINNIRSKFRGNEEILIKIKETELPLSMMKKIGIIDEKNNIQYNYIVDEHQIFSDLPVNLLLLSYEKNEAEIELIHSKILLLKSILITTAIIVRRLNIKLKDNLNQEKARQELEELETIINKILKYQKNINRGKTNELTEEVLDIDEKINKILSPYFKNEESIKIHFNYKYEDSTFKEYIIEESGNQFAIYSVNNPNDKIFYKTIDEILEKLKDKISENDYTKIEKYKHKVYDEKRNKLLNVELITKILSSKTIFTEEELDTFEKLVDEYIDKDEYIKFEKIIRSLTSDNFNSRHFYKFFDIFAIDNTIIDSMPSVGMFMPLTEYLREEEMKKNSIYEKNNRTVSMIGFSVLREQENNGEIGKVVEKYPKTFMGKTMLQVLTDLRVNGRSHKLDAIYEENNNRKIFYSIIPLTLYGPFLKLKREMGLDNFLGNSTTITR